MALRDLGVRLVVEGTGQFRSDISTYNRGVETATARTQALGQAARSTGIAMAAFGGAIVGFGLVSAKAASSLEESVNAVNVVFGEASQTVLDFSKNSATAAGLATAEFNQLAAVTGALLTDTSLTIQEVAEQTNILAVRAADMASVMDTDVQDALFAVNAALRGETEPIRRYTGDVTDATLQQFLLSQGIERSVRDFSEQEKRLLRLQVIMQQTDKFAGDFARTSESLANQTRIANSQFTNARAILGTALIPLLTDVIQAVTPLIQSFARFAEENPKLVETLFLVGAAIAAVGVALVAITPIVLGLVGASIGLGVGLLPLIGIVAGITAAIAAGLIIWRNWDTIVEKVKETVNALIEIINKAIDVFFRLNPLLAPFTFGAEALGFDITPEIPTFAHGGTMRRGGRAIVGERGPEVVTLPAGAQVTPISRINEINVQAQYTNPQEPQSLRNDMEFVLMSLQA